MQGPRPGAGRKPKEATILKEKLGDFAYDAIRAFKFCSSLMDDNTADPGLRLAAAREVMDRLWGKPTQAVQLSGKDGGPITISELVAQHAD